MDELDDNLEVFWGLYEDDTLEDEVKVAIIATGFDTESVSVQARQDDEDKQRMIDLMREKYYGKSRSVPKAFEQELPFEEDKKEEVKEKVVSLPKSDEADDIQDLNLSAIKKKRFRINGDSNKILELNTSDLTITSRLSKSYERLTKYMDEVGKILSKLPV